MRRTVRKGRW
uniref:Uncharacterized protein n=1 Tax=Arundo donax TaxID=35708 RepID=A0A0A9BS67_ARUDO